MRRMYNRMKLPPSKMAAMSPEGKHLGTIGGIRDFRGGKSRFYKKLNDLLVVRQPKKH